MHWIGFPGRVTYINQDFLIFQEILQLPHSGWVNLGITEGPSHSSGSRQCAGWRPTGIFPYNVHCHKTATAAFPKTLRNLHWTMWPNHKRQTSALNNSCKSLNIRNTKNNPLKVQERVDKATYSFLPSKDSKKLGKTSWQVFLNM